MRIEVFMDNLRQQEEIKKKNDLQTFHSENNSNNSKDNIVEAAMYQENETASLENNKF